MEITYDFIFKKKANGEYYYIQPIDKNSIINPLYNKEIYVPAIERNRDILIQSLGYMGCCSNNYFDSTIDYIFLPDSTVDNFQFGIKDDIIKWIESACEDQKSKNPKLWKFSMKFIIENEVIDYIKKRAERVGEDCILDLMKNY